ncbi:unnamed protein product, partial [Brenthis ino]
MTLRLAASRVVSGNSSCRAQLSGAGGRGGGARGAGWHVAGVGARGRGSVAGATRASRAPCARRSAREAHSSSERALYQPPPSGMSILLLVFARRVPLSARSASVSTIVNPMQSRQRAWRTIDRTIAALNQTIDASNSPYIIATAVWGATQGKFQGSVSHGLCQPLHSSHRNLSTKFGPHNALDQYNYLMVLM